MARFTLPARLVVVWWPFASQPTNLAAPTQAQITAGVNLIGSSQGEGLAQINGFTQEPGTIATPDYSGRVVGTVPGDVTIPDSSLSFYMDTTARVIYNAMVVDAVGVVGFFYDGTAATKESKLFVATITSKDRHNDRDQGHMFTSGFSPSAPVIGTAVA